jgi:hypothetical protein
MSDIVQYFHTQGVPIETIGLLLIFPIIATMIAFFRQVVGIKAFGIYTPSIVIFAFLATGIKYGIVLFLSVILVGMTIRFAMKRLRLLYLPRVAITLTFVAIVMLVVLAVGGSLQRTGLAAVSIFPLLIMITLVEKFVTAQVEKGTKNAIFLALETLIISLIGYYLASWQWLIHFILAYPWIVLLVIPLNIFMGRWTGLRLAEYYRFKEVLKKI